MNEQYPSPEERARIREEVLARAKNKCEFCGAPNHADHPLTGKFAVLTIVRLNHNQQDYRPENLRALCQVCRQKHERKIQNSMRRKDERKGQMLLFDEEAAA